MIDAGNILVDHLPAAKAGTRIGPENTVAVRDKAPRFVSRGGLKLAAGLKAFHIDVTGRTCLDVGASTGGFTDCLLQHGADCVYAVDVGYGQLAWRLRQDPRVIVIERTNIRYMAADRIPRPVSLITVDVSFISLRIVVPAVLKFLDESGTILVLIKPQFEVGKGKVGKGGVVRDPALHDAVLADLKTYFTGIGLVVPPPCPLTCDGSQGQQGISFGPAPSMRKKIHAIVFQQKGPRVSVDPSDHHRFRAAPIGHLADDADAQSRRHAGGHRSHTQGRHG